ncbi:hypothetical protein BH11MYX2_BH11MYX2_02550 [soil metagenome]
MRSVLGGLVLLVASTSSADSGATWLARGAHDAAVRGDCEKAYDLAARAKALDPALYDTTVSTDPALAACALKPRPAPVIVSVQASLPAPRHHVSEVSSARVVGQSMFALFGTVVGAVIAIAPLVESCDDEGCGDSPVLFALAGIGAGLGAGIAVSLVGAGDDGDASGFAAVGLGIVGGLAAGAIGAFGNQDVGGMALLLLPTVGAMSGCYLTRETADDTLLEHETFAPIAPSTSLVPGARAAIVPLGRFSF